MNLSKNMISKNQEKRKTLLCYIYSIFIIYITYPRSRNGFQRLLIAHFLHGVVIFLLIFRHEHLKRSAGFLLLLIKIVDDHSDKQIEGKKRSKYNEKHEVEIHVNVRFANRLLVNLQMIVLRVITCKSIENRNYIAILTSLESIASFMIWIHPLKVATWNRHKYAFPT